MPELGMSDTGVTELPEERASVLHGAYVDLEALLALRHKPQPPSESLTSRVVGNQAGIKLSKLKGRGIDFAEVRPYQPGDDIRTIDWRVTARKNKPHTKVFREERERPTLIVVDQTQSMFFGSVVRLKSVVAAELAARIAWQTLAAGDRVGGVVIGNAKQSVHRPYRTTKSIARLMHDVAQFNQALHRDHAIIGDSVAEGLMQVRRITRTNYRIFVLSDFSDDLTLWQDNLHKLARHNQIVCLHILDPLERELPPANHYAVTDGKQRLQFYTGNANLRQEYAEQFEQRCDALRAICAHDAMRYVDVRTSDDNLDHMVWL
jgi:uncharacterized protein (DUF58 family)